MAYRKQTEPLLEYYGRAKLLKSIDGLGTVDEIFDRAKQFWKAVVGGDSSADLRSWDLGLGFQAWTKT